MQPLNIFNTLINPDKNVKNLKLYHYSSKLLIPQLVGSYFLINRKNDGDYTKHFAQVFTTFTLMNTGYHSYVSMSMILNDYLQKLFTSKHIINSVKCSNAGLHLLACVGYVKHNIRDCTYYQK